MPLFRSLSETAASCCAAGDGDGAATAAWATAAYVLRFVGAGVACGGWLSKSLACLDSGDGAATRLFASEAPRGGTFTFCSVRAAGAGALFTASTPRSFSLL